jgi:hypothetical protein
MAEYVRFETGQPQEVALKFADGKEVEGQYGEQVMYSLTDGRVMYVEPIVGAHIRRLQIQPGECFFIEKRKKGRVNDWHVYREADEPPAAEVERPTRKRTPPAHVLANTLVDRVEARNAASRLEEQLRDSITLVDAKKAAAAAPPPPPPPPARPMASAAAPQNPQDRWKAVLLAQTNALTDVYAAALAHASSSHGNAIKPEDIRALMTTAFINLSKGAQNRAA